MGGGVFRFAILPLQLEKGPVEQKRARVFCDRNCSQINLASRFTGSFGAQRS